MKRPEFGTVADALHAIKSALLLAEVPCGDCPTPEGWNSGRLVNTCTVRRACRAVDWLMRRRRPGGEA